MRTVNYLEVDYQVVPTTLYSFVLSVADVVMSTTLATFNPYLVDS